MQRSQYSAQLMIHYLTYNNQSFQLHCCLRPGSLYLKVCYKLVTVRVSCSHTVFQLGLFLRALRPARTGLRPARTGLSPARFTRALPEFKKKIVLFLQNVIAVFVFSDSRYKNACKMLADLCPCFHQSPTKPNFGRSRVKVCPILCRLRTKLCPNFGRSRARLCPISFASCPFPDLAGTLAVVIVYSPPVLIDNFAMPPLRRNSW